MKKLYFMIGILSALTFASFANLPNHGGTSGSLATSSDVSEIRSKRHADLSFDSDLKHLADVQGRFHENLPLRKASHDQIRSRPSVRKPSPRKIKSKGAPLKASRVRAKVTQN